MNKAISRYLLMTFYSLSVERIQNSVEETIKKRQIQYISLRDVLGDKNMRFSGILERGW